MAGAVMRRLLLAGAALFVIGHANADVVTAPAPGAAFQQVTFTVAGANAWVVPANAVGNGWLDGCTGGQSGAGGQANASTAGGGGGGAGQCITQYPVTFAAGSTITFTNMTAAVSPAAGASGNPPTGAQTVAGLTLPTDTLAFGPTNIVATTGSAGTGGTGGSGVGFGAPVGGAAGVNGNNATLNGANFAVGAGGGGGGNTAGSAAAFGGAYLGEPIARAAGGGTGGGGPGASSIFGAGSAGSAVNAACTAVPNYGGGGGGGGANGAGCPGGPAFWRLTYSVH